jgi:SAM-dependent methyltransferase
VIEEHEVNRLHWDEVTLVHKGSAFYDLPGFLAGRNMLDPVAREGLGDVRGKSLLHLQCHFGLDTLSSARMGARVTGVDFSQAAIASAEEIAHEAGLADQARFIHSDVLELNSVLDEKFDLVFTSHGTVTWLNDIRRWAGVVAAHLKPDGLFYFLDNHPTGLLFETRGDGPPQVYFDYYHSNEPLVFENETDYADRSYCSKGPTRAWIWSMEDIFGALEECGLAISQVREYPFNVYEQFRSMRRDEQGYWRTPQEWPKLPLMLGFKARWK